MTASEDGRLAPIVPLVVWRDDLDESSHLDCRAAVSLKPTRPSDMRAQTAALGPEYDPNWLFAVGRKEDVQHIADTLGFWFRRDPTTGQYDHPTLLVAVGHGRAVRALVGYPFSYKRVRELVWELRGRFVPCNQLPGQSWLRYFAFDGRTRARCSPTGACCCCWHSE